MQDNADLKRSNFLLVEARRLLFAIELTPNNYLYYFSGSTCSLVGPKSPTNRSSDLRHQKRSASDIGVALFDAGKSADSFIDSLYCRKSADQCVDLRCQEE